MSRRFGPSGIYPSSRPEGNPSQEPEQREGADRITPVMPIPEWLRDTDEREPAQVGDPAAEDTELGFWNAPPRYSVIGPSLPPAVLVSSPSRVRVWSARVLFSAVLCAVVTLLGVEASSLLHGAIIAQAPAGPHK